jgi:hypothetical protein
LTPWLLCGMSDASQGRLGSEILLDWLARPSGGIFTQ